MFSQINIFTRAFVVFVIILFVVGALSSTSLNDSDLINFLRNGAEADRTRADTQWVNEIRQMELPYLEQERAAQSKITIAEVEQQASLLTAETEYQVKVTTARTEAEILQIQEAAAFEKEQHQQDLANQVMWRSILQLAAQSAVLVLVIGLGYGFLRFVHAMTQPNRRETRPTALDHPSNLWNDRTYRKNEIRRARQLEQFNRQRTIDGTPIIFVASKNGNQQAPREPSLELPVYLRSQSV